MIKAIIVDDEPLALDVLETYIEKIPEIELVAKCENALEANEVLKSMEVDLMFLDIQMPQLTGTEFLKTLTKQPKVIFTTAYPEFALEGFELNAVDYLLKPISFERFMTATNKVTSQIDSSSSNDTKASFFFVKSNKKLMKILYEDILYIEGLKDYVIIRTNTGRIITLQTMKSLEAKLPSKLFKRIHRSYIVGIKKINAVMGNMVEIIEKGEAKHLPIGKIYRDELLDIVNKNRL